MKKFLFVLSSILFLTGCVSLFGWTIHAPGILSNSFYSQIEKYPERIALYLPPDFASFIATNRGGKLADPQQYFVGESMAPMTLEALQASFEEFIFLEVEPTPELLQAYKIPYVLAISLDAFDNQVQLKGHRVGIRTDCWLFNQNIEPLIHFSVDGSSEAYKTFSKKGGPELNLNAAIENNLIAMIHFLQAQIIEMT